MTARKIDDDDDNFLKYILNFLNIFYFVQYVTQEGKLLTSERLSPNIVLLAGHFLESLWLCALCWTPLKPSMLNMVWKHYSY